MNWKFWKKKPKKEKVLDENASQFQKMWHNKRTHAAMVLGMYAVFFTILLIIMSCSSNVVQNDVKNPKEEEITYKEMLNNLRKSNYSFEYDIKVFDYKVNYKGEKKKNETTGYRENNEEIIKYRIKDREHYKVIGENEEQIDNLYDKIDSRYIDLNYIINLLETREYVAENKSLYNIYKYEFSLIDERVFSITITTTKENISKIDITVNDVDTYLLKFSNIGS